MIPVLIVGYKRVIELQNLAESCISQGAEKIYIAIDGNRQGEPSVIKKFKQLLIELKKNAPKVEIYTWIRHENLGSAASVITAIDWALKYENEIAILEDDLIISDQLLEYLTVNMKSLTVEKLMITGTNVFENQSLIKRTGKTHFPVVWGWATSNQNWQRMRQGIFSPELSYQKSTKRRVRSFLETGRIRAQKRQIDAWDVPLAAWMYANSYLCLVPSTNLVSNRGFGESATHTAFDKWPLNLSINSIIQIEESWNDDSQVCNFDDDMIKNVLKIRIKHAVSKELAIIKSVINSSNTNPQKLKNFIDSVEIPSIEKGESK